MCEKIKINALNIQYKILIECSMKTSVWVKRIKRANELDNTNKVYHPDHTY